VCDSILVIQLVAEFEKIYTIFTLDIDWKCEFFLVGIMNF